MTVMMNKMDKTKIIKKNWRTNQVLKKACGLLVMALILGFMVFPVGVAADKEGGNGETYIVTLKDDADASATFENKYDLTQLTAVDHGIYVTDGENADVLENSSIVESVTESKTRTTCVAPNDPNYTGGSQWALSAINAEEGWDVTTGAADVTVVVIDTGFTYDHKDNGHVVAGKDYITKKTNTEDCETHGTATAGLIGAATNNALGIAGACWDVNVVMLRALYVDTSGSEPQSIGRDADIIAAVYDAVDVYNADVISMSFGGTNTYKALKTAYQYAYNHGAILVAAAGNAGQNNSPLEYPAAYDEVIGVAAVNSNLQKAPYSTANESVYIAAPGSNIRSLGNAAYAGNDYISLDGTSLATPYVAALAALARSVDPDISQEEFKYYLRLGSTDLAPTGYDINTGYGLIDYGATLKAIVANQSDTKPAGTGTASDPYLLSNESELHWFKTAVNSGKTAICASLTGDIHVTETSWYPIETYNGAFYGNGHTIFMGTNENSLFASIGENGVVSRLTVSGDISKSENRALIATENHGNISDCVAAGSVTGTYAGGICVINYGDLTRCVNSAALSAANYSGGIAAITAGGSITYCYNTGGISSGTNHAGGICAFAKEGATISSCYNTGVISGSVVTRGIVVKVSDSTISNCFYDKSVITVGSSSTSICGKTTDTMKSSGFICLLNHGSGYFGLDTQNLNNGYPVLSASTLTAYFNDVPINAWYVDYVYALAATGIVQGKGGGKYAPEDAVSRAEYTALLARATGSDLSAYANQASFADVENNQWYTAAIAWAYDNHIVNGVGNQRFAPNSSITREEIAAITARYIKQYKNSDLSPSATLPFSDSETIAGWAKESVALMTELGILAGFNDGHFGPRERATRAQAATILDRLLKASY